MTPPQPIPTRYAGCWFRSRLEARWAVAFDFLGLTWEYEAQGYRCGHRLTLVGEGTETFPYLPDFWLPDLGVFAEVKGALAEAEFLKVLDAAASLSSADGGGCHDSGGHDVAVLGPIPHVRRNRNVGGPWILHMHKGQLSASEWTAADSAGYRGCRAYGSTVPLADDYGGDWADIGQNSGMTADQAARFLLRGAVSPASYWAGAYEAAASARFEHGQTATVLGPPSHRRSDITKAAPSTLASGAASDPELDDDPRLCFWCFLGEVVPCPVDTEELHGDEEVEIHLESAAHESCDVCDACGEPPFHPVLNPLKGNA